MEPVESPVRIGDVDRLDAVTGPMRDWIAAADLPGELDGYAVRAADVAGQLIRAGTGALPTCQALTSLHDALTVRLIRLAEADLGPPPCPYTWLALGSGGRMEQALHADQDNAIVYATGHADAYFGRLGGHVVAGLARAGLPRCTGGYMADRWHLPVAGWQRMFGRWIESPEPKALVEAEVFLDFRSVCGQLPVAALDEMLRHGSRAPRFLVGMARAAVVFPPPLGLAGWIRTEHGAVDLKRGGLAAIVLLARLYALAAGSLARSTTDRLAAAAAAGTLSQGGAGELADGYRFLADLRLIEQLRAVAAGTPATNRVRLADLSGEQRTQLRQVLRIVRDLQRATELRFPTTMAS